MNVILQDAVQRWVKEIGENKRIIIVAANDVAFRLLTLLRVRDDFSEKELIIVDNVKTGDFLGRPIEKLESLRCCDEIEKYSILICSQDYALVLEKQINLLLSEFNLNIHKVTDYIVNDDKSVLTTCDRDEAEFVLLNKEPYWKEFSVRENEIFSFSVVVKGKAKSTNRALVRFVYYDQAGKEVENIGNDGSYYSPEVGRYFYLPVAENQSIFQKYIAIPPGVSRLSLGFQTWFAKKPISIGQICFEKTDKKPPEEQLEYINEQFCDFCTTWKGAEQVVLLISGGSAVVEPISHRNIHLALEFAKRKIPVILTYYRYDHWDIEMPIVNKYIFQLPYDMFVRDSKIVFNILDEASQKLAIISFPTSDVAAKLGGMKFSGWKLIYDCIDNWEEFHNNDEASWYESSVEKYVVNFCDYTTCVTKYLQSKMRMNFSREMASRVFVVPNGYVQGFKRNFYKRKPMKKPVVGYFGNMSPGWFDWDSLIAIADKRPEYIFELIGTRFPENLNLPSNVYFLGECTHEEINRIVQNWSAGVICFKAGKLAEGVDPIKIYEYLSLELPTVSFPMSQIETYPYTLLVNDVDEFAIALDYAVETKVDKKRTEKWLYDNTWGERVKSFLTITGFVEENIISEGE